MSILGKLVAVRAIEGGVTKGWTADFKPGCREFHLQSSEGSVTTMEVKNLKAVFFIKTMEGNPHHEERKDFELKKMAEKKIWVEFTDGEALAGWSSALGGKDGFYITPTDPDSNLERVFVFRAAVKQILQGPAAEAAARDHQPSPGRGASSGPRVFDLD